MRGRWTRITGATRSIVGVKQMRAQGCHPDSHQRIEVEWADGRRRVWQMLMELRQSRTLDAALDIRRELEAASELFLPTRSEADCRPIRVFWELIAAMGAAQASPACRETIRWSGLSQAQSHRAGTSQASSMTLGLRFLAVVHLISADACGVSFVRLSLTRFQPC
jgi:hypothetical protein